MDDTDEELMRRALLVASSAVEHDDVPVGCIVVVNGEVIAEAENRREVDGDPTAHAEILALRQAAKVARGSWRLEDADVYVTLEPCVMCAGALLAARVRRVVIGASDPRTGAVGSRYNVLADPRLYHEVATTHDVLGDESSALLRSFFESRRAVDPTGG